MEVKNALAMRSGSMKVSKVVPVDSKMGVRAADAVFERSVWDMQTTRSLIAYCEWAHNTTSELDTVTFASSVEFSGQVIGRLPSNASDGRATCDRWEQEGCFKELILFGDMVTPSEKPEEKGKVWNRVSIVLALVDRSTSCDRTVCREETSRTSVVLCEAVVKRVPVRQRCDAMIPILQPNPAEVAEDEQPTRVSCVEQSVVQVWSRECTECVGRFSTGVEGVRSEELQRVTTTLSFAGMLS